MVCRKVVILNGAEGHGATKGIVTVSDAAGRANVKIDVFGLPVPGAEYTAAIRVDGRFAVYRARGADSAEFSGTEEWKVSPSSKIEAAVGTGGRTLACGANYAAADWQVKELVAARAPVPARPAASMPDEAPPVEAKVLAAGGAEIAAATVDTAAAIDAVETADPSVTADAEAERAPAPELTDYERSEARRRAAYDDERIADVDFYPPEFETRIDRGRYVARREAAAELDAWGGYNAVYKPRLAPRAETPQRDVPSYYLSVKETLDRLFASAPAEQALNRSLSPSRWVRVDYREGLYYCVGLIGGLPDYIGYAVPGVYSLNPPRQMAGLCKWLPLDREDPHGHGYWMMFQDAVTGAGVRLPSADSAV